MHLIIIASKTAVKLFWIDHQIAYLQRSKEFTFKTKLEFAKFQSADSLKPFEGARCNYAGLLFSFKAEIKVRNLDHVH